MASREDALERYRQLVAHVDVLTSRLDSRYRSFMVCRAGCWGCCRHSLSVFPLEAVFLDRAIRNLPVMVRDVLKEQDRLWLLETGGEKEDGCPLLLQGFCAVYERRPIICRTQGYPLLIESEEGPAVDTCPLNFASAEARDTLCQEQLIPLEEINMRLALANLLFCRAQGIPDRESVQRISLRTLLQAAL